MRRMEIEANRPTGHVGAVGHDLQDYAIGAQHEMLVSTRVDQDALQSRQCREIDTCCLRRVGSRCRVKHGHPSVGQPNDGRLQGTKARISERTRRPMPALIVALRIAFW